MNFLWAFLASSTAISLEVFYKQTTRSWVALLPLTIGPILFLNYALCKLLRGNTLLSAFILFGLCNIVIRIGTTMFYLKEPVSKGIWVALVLVVLANAAKWGIR